MNLKKSFNYLFFFIAILFTVFSCDIVKKEDIEPVKGNFEDTSNTQTKKQKKVLLEYFTGHKCGTCPQSGGLGVKQLKELYGPRVVIMVVHAGFFATPSTSSTKYNYDFRTAGGNALATRFKLSSTPQGLVNRAEYNNSFLQTPSSWAPALQSKLTDSVYFNLQIKPAFTSSTGVLNATIEITALRNVTDSQILEVFVTEDSLVNWQTDYNLDPQDIENYVHKYALRGSMVVQDPIIDGMTLKTGNRETIIVNFIWNPAWNIRKARIVAVLTDRGLGTVTDVEETLVP